MRKIFLLILAISCFPVFASDEHPEDRLLDAVNAIQQGNFELALQRLKRLTTQLPDFKLAQLMYADVLRSRVEAFDMAAAGIDEAEQRNLLLQEVKNRYLASRDQNTGKRIPSVLARLDAHYRHAIVVDLEKSRLYVFSNHASEPELVNDYFISMGRGGPGKFNEGDLKTPLGVYFVQSYIPPLQLADKYGAGAYPINYPNAWDRINGRTGHGIWLHGTRSGTYNRPPLASEGCVVLPNPDLLDVGSYIELKNTPVLIGEKIEWLEQAQWKKYRQQFTSLHSQWEADWESLNVDNYLKHYSQRFVSGSNSLDEWARHKRRVSQHKTFVDVELSNVSLLVHPDEDVMVATYLQHYRSDNFTSQSWKRQYWNKEADGQWRIVFEDRITPPVPPQLARSEY